MHVSFMLEHNNHFEKDHFINPSEVTKKAKSNEFYSLDFFFVKRSKLALICFYKRASKIA